VRETIRHQREARRQADHRSCAARIKSVVAEMDERHLDQYLPLFTAHADANHRLDRAAFATVMHEAFAASAYCVARLFDEFDHDLNGIDWREFSLVMKLLGRTDADAIPFLNFAFTLFDINQNGTLGQIDVFFTACDTCNSVVASHAHSYTRTNLALAWCCRRQYP
jgi:Ca2+-binding EF-hand superfamily protein